MKKKFAAGSVLAVAALVVTAMTGCGSSSGNSSSAAAPASSSASSTSAQATSSSVSSSAAADSGSSTVDIKQMTAPGKEVKFGEPVTIYQKYGTPDKDYYNEFLYEVTYTSIDAAPMSDFSSIKDADTKLKGYAPFYVRAKLTLKAAAKPIKNGASSTISGLKPVQTGKTSGGTFTVIGSFAPCKDAGDLKAVGDTVDTCDIAIASGNNSIIGMAYTGYSSNYKSYSDNPYTDNPIFILK